MRYFLEKKGDTVLVLGAETTKGGDWSITGGNLTTRLQKFPFARLVIPKRETQAGIAAIWAETHGVHLVVETDFMKYKPSWALVFTPQDAARCRELGIPTVREVTV